jgi:hypothetical protein
MEDVDAETERKRDPRRYIFGFGRRSSPYLVLNDVDVLNERQTMPWLRVGAFVAVDSDSMHDRDT